MTFSGGLRVRARGVGAAMAVEVKDVTDWSRSEKYNRLKKSLLENLEARGLVERVYADKVEEYMGLWVRLRQLREDVRERGITVMDEKRGMLVENRSVSLEVQVSRQMLAIFTALGFRDDAIKALGSAGDDDDDL